ncbi:MAG: hypothetical protein KIT31_16750 [Deltaproteobacteria bacterium]|nr:hypothetical protein [Deltaproteobacteria bacterium]
MRLLSKVLAAALLVGAVAPEARAWEPETTHGGLAEQAALGSRLHKRLVTMGFTNGLFEPLTIPPADAPALMSALKLLSPTHGAVPDARGRQPALGWIAAGAALADVPRRTARTTSSTPTPEAERRAPDRASSTGSATACEAVAREAPRARRAGARLGRRPRQPVQRRRLPRAVREGGHRRDARRALAAHGGDEAAHFDQLGAGPDDLGSRFERIAALAYGRLGVPPPSRVVTRTHLRDFFTAKDGGGLADRVAHGYFSPNTLPTPTRIEGDVRPKLVRPRPALPARLNLMAASRDEGTILRDANGTCLARYRVTHSVLTFSIDDECMLEQLAVIVPEVAAYERGLLDFLLRGELNIAAGAEIVVSGTGLGDGTVELVVEDERGVRTKLASAPVAKATEQLASVAAPAAGARVYAVFRGVDLLGEPIVAVGAAPLAAR